MTLPVVAVAAPVVSRSGRVRPVGKRIRSQRKSLSFPQAAPGENAAVGLTDWETYFELDRRLGASGFRVRFLRGIIEIMSTSKLHEILKKNLAKFLETFCEENSIIYDGHGSATQQIAGESAGQPDESYIFGGEDKEWPDLVIEIALSSGGIDKLDFWATMRISEVWIWENGALHLFVYDKRDGYQSAAVSRWLPGIDLALMQELAALQPTSEAAREFRARISLTSENKQS